MAVADTFGPGSWSLRRRTPGFRSRDGSAACMTSAEQFQLFLPERIPPVTSSPTVTLATRDAISRDDYAITRLLTDALAASPLGGWLEPDPRRRPQTALDYIGPLVQQAIGSGIVRLAEQDRAIVGAALWSLHPCADPPAATSTAGAGIETVREVSRRRCRLHRFTESHRPAKVQHQQLVYLGVHPDRRGQDIGNHLLTQHHALLDDTGTPAYAVVVDRGTLDVLARHQYARIGRPEPLAGGVLARALWRLPRSANASRVGSAVRAGIGEG